MREILIIICLWVIMPLSFSQQESIKQTDGFNGNVYTLKSELCKTLSFNLPNIFQIDITEHNLLPLYPELSEFGTNNYFSLNILDISSYDTYSIEIACISDSSSSVLSEDGLVTINESTNNFEVSSDGWNNIMNGLIESHSKGQTPELEELEQNTFFQISEKNIKGWLLNYGISGEKYYLTYTSFCVFDNQHKGAWCGKYRSGQDSGFYRELLPIVRSMKFVD